MFWGLSWKVWLALVVIAFVSAAWSDPPTEKDSGPDPVFQQFLELTRCAADVEDVCLERAGPEPPYEPAYSECVKELCAHKEFDPDEVERKKK